MTEPPRSAGDSVAAARGLQHAHPEELYVNVTNPDMPEETTGGLAGKLAGKVKASLIDAQDISANSFKVVTERAVVYLMGRVTEREGARASEIARGVAGVQKVVKVFEYITEDDVRQMSNTPARQ